MLSMIVLELTLREVLADLPHDAGTGIVLVLLLALVGFVWHGWRGGASSASAAPVAAAVPEGLLEVPAPGPAAEPVVFHPAMLAEGRDVSRMHAEVR